MKYFCSLIAFYFIASSLHGQTLRGNRVEIQHDQDLHKIDMSSDGDVMIVGDWYGGIGGNYKGLVEVHAFENGQWNLKGTPFYGTENGDYTGEVSITQDGQRIGIGTDEGAKIYDYISSDWSQAGSTVPFSFVALSKDGSTMLCGESAGQSQTLYLYRWIGNDWEQMSGQLEITGGFGIQFSFDGSMASVMNSDGIAKFYDFSNDDWTEILTPIDIGTNNWSPLHGFSASADLSSIVISSGNKVLVYRLDGNSWNLEFTKDIARSLDASISPDGNKLAYYDNYSNNSQGSFSVYHFYNGEWQSIGMTQAGLFQNAQLGEKLKISDDGYLVGVLSAGAIGVGNGEIQQYQFNDICGRIFYEPENSMNCEFLQPYQDTWPFDDEGVKGTVVIEPGSIIAESDESGYWFLNDLPDGDYSLTSSDEMYKHDCQDTLYFSIENNRMTSPVPEWAYNERLYDVVWVRVFSDRNENCLYEAGSESLWRNVEVTINPGNIQLMTGSSGVLAATDLPEGEYTLRVTDSDYSISCDSIISFQVENIDSTITLPGLAVQKENRVNGSLYFDADVNCFMDADESMASNTLVKLSSVTPVRYASTDINGSFYFENIPIGDHVIELVEDSLYFGCDSFEFELNSNEVNKQLGPLGLVQNSDCIHTNIRASSNRIRPCFDFQRISFKAENRIYSIDTLRDPYVEFALEPWIRIDSLSHAYTIDSNNLVRVPIKDLAPNEYENVNIFVTPDCDVPVGTTLCIDFTLFPVDPCMLAISDSYNLPMGDCSEEWDGSHIDLSRSCDGDSIHFYIENNSAFDMECYRPYIIYRDYEIIVEDSVKLAANEVKTISFAAERNTFRLSCKQHPYHPGRDRPVAYVENCGTEGEWTSGIIRDFPLNNLDFHVDVECRRLRAAYDPNDKMGYPLGIGDDHCIQPNQPIDYRVRFQNTGNDTAFKIFIIDTLDTSVLEIESFEIGLASHPMTYEISGQGIIRFDFENILLPDSTTNEPASHGYVDFRVDQKRNLPDETKILNNASIYFDFNDPIVTNTSLHTVFGDLKTISSIEEIGEVEKVSYHYNISPNPSSGIINLKYTGVNSRDDHAVFSLYDVEGKVLQTGKVAESTNLLLPPASGIYFIVINLSNGQSEMHKVVRTD